MKKISIVFLAVLFTGSVAEAQYYPPPPPVVQPILVNGQLLCPGGYRGPIQSTPGGAWVCVR
jgi:hypothetical protein